MNIIRMKIGFIPFFFMNNLMYKAFYESGYFCYLRFK